MSIVPDRGTGAAYVVPFLLLAALYPAAPAAAAQDADQVIEEVVVTGSYIRRSAANSPSPLSVIDRADIEDIGVIEVADLVNRMTYNSGSTNKSNAGSGGDNSTGETNINLRNLGLGSTLVLLNGKRMVAGGNDAGGNAYVNTSTLVPSIALQRLEVVKDGASALYGSDAVAGVANFITRKDFEGFELSVDGRTDQETREQTDITLSAIWGATTDRGHISVSGEYLDRGGLRIEDRYDDFGRSGISTLGNPGSFVPASALPSSDPRAGATTAAWVVGGGGQLGDLDCQLASNLHRQSFLSPLTGSPLASSPLESTGACIYDYEPFFNLVGKEERYLTHADFNYRLNERAEVYGEFSYAHQEFQRGNSLFPLVRFPFIPAGNPGVQNAAERRQATLDALAAAGNPTGQALAPVDLPNTIAGTTFFGRVLGFTPDDTGTDLRPVDTDTREFDNQYRTVLGLRGDFPLELASQWTYDVSFTYSQRDGQARGPDTNQQNLQAAVAGLGGPRCNPARGTPGSGNAGTGDCYYYNPFFSAFFKPDGTRQDDPALVNPTDLTQWMVGEFRSNSKNEQTTIDAVVTGDLMELPNGLPLGMAFGLQWRNDKTFFDADDTSNAGGFSFTFGADDFDGEEDVYAAFVEFAIPVSEDIDVQLAGRYEKFDKLGEQSFDPKLTALWRATDALTLRASTGTSFRVASLLQRFGSSTQLLNIADPFSGAGLAFRPQIAQGNPDLKPEEAFTWNVGMSIVLTEGLLDGFSADVDFYSYDYDDLITREGAQSLNQQDIASRCPQGLNDDPNDSIPDCGVQPDGEIISIGPGIPDKIIRDDQGNYLRAEPTFVNAQKLKTSGVDWTLAYEWPTEGFGLFNAGMQGTWAREYELTLPSGRTLEGVGRRNFNTVIGRSMPELKINYTLGWQLARHRAFLMVRWIDSYKDDQPVQMADLNGDGTEEPACVGSCLRATVANLDLLDDKLDSWTTVDLQYNYELSAIGFMPDSRITIGGINIFNKRPPPLNFDGLYDPFVHDPRGAIWYLRYTTSL